MIKRTSNTLPQMLLATLLLWSAGILEAVAAEQPPAKAAEEVIKVVYHADFADPRRFSAMLANIHNMVSTYQSELKDYDVRIVFVSYGIRFVTQDKLAGTPFAEDAALKQRRADLLGRLATLRDNEGVKLELCEITREAVHLPREKIIPGVVSVPSGVVRIVELQRQGYAYLKVE
jgi:intracellular sulfur oxidation DsrE/DsrF family protein